MMYEMRERVEEGKRHHVREGKGYHVRRVKRYHVSWRNCGEM